MPHSDETARKAYSKRYYLANKAKIRAYNKRYITEHPERVAEYRRREKERQRDGRRAAAKQRWYLSNPEKVAAQRERLKAQSPEVHSAKLSAKNHRRRERVTWAVGPKLETATIVAVLSYGTGLYASFVQDQEGRSFWAGALAVRRCEYCMAEAKLTIDHLLPLSRGGTNGLLNLAAICQSCNGSKHSRTPIECASWLPVTVKRDVGIMPPRKAPGTRFSLESTE